MRRFNKFLGVKMSAIKRNGLNVIKKLLRDGRWILFIYTLIAISLILYALKFTWVALVAILAFLGLMGFFWLIIWFINKKPQLSLILIFSTIVILFYITSSKIFDDALYNWLDPKIHVDYLVGAVDVGALLLAFIGIFSQQNIKDKENLSRKDNRAYFYTKATFYRNGFKRSTAISNGNSSMQRSKFRCLYSRNNGMSINKSTRLRKGRFIP